MSTAVARGRDGYTYVSQPQPVAAGRTKFREGDPTARNLMSDPRVVRGPTFTIRQDTQPEPEPTIRRQYIPPEVARKSRYIPEPVVEERKEIDILLYLTEQVTPKKKAESETQTDKFLDRVPSPPYLPKQTGIDAETQVYKDDLFVFDREVEPIVDVLVSKLVEQAIMEVREEDEIALMKLHQAEYHSRRAAEQKQIKALEDAEAARFAAKEARLVAERKRLAEETELRHKIASRAYASMYLQDLRGDAFNDLAKAGLFFEDVEREIENNFMPWLMESVVERLGGMHRARNLVEAVVRDSNAARGVIFEQHLKMLEDARLKAEAEAEAKRKAEEDARLAAEAARLAKEKEDEEARLREEQGEEEGSEDDDDRKGASQRSGSSSQPSSKGSRSKTTTSRDKVGTSSRNTATSSPASSHRLLRK